MLTAEFPGELNLISCLLQSTGLYFSMWTRLQLHGYGKGNKARMFGGVQRACARRSMLRRTDPDGGGCGQNSGPEQGRFKNIVLAALGLYPIASTFVSPNYSLPNKDGPVTNGRYATRLTFRSLRVS